MVFRLVLLNLIWSHVAGYFAQTEFETEQWITRSVFASFDGSYLEIDNRSKSCLGPPYLYVTSRKKKTNILKYTRDGCFLSEKVLIDGPGLSSYIDFRSMALAANGDLYISNAADMNSGVLIYGPCISGNDTIQSRRFYRNNPAIRDLFGIIDNETLWHPNSSAENGTGADVSDGQRMYKGVVTNVRSNPGAEHPYGLALDPNQA